MFNCLSNYAMPNFDKKNFKLKLWVSSQTPKTIFPPPKILGIFYRFGHSERFER